MSLRSILYFAVKVREYLFLIRNVFTSKKYDSMFPVYSIATKKNFDKVVKEWIQLLSSNWVLSLAR